MMNPNFGPMFGKYGVATTFYFSVAVPSATDDNRLLDAAVPWIAGDVLVSKDGGAVANIGTLPTRIGTTPLYAFTLTAAEMQATHVVVYLVDADGPAWRDLMIHILTKLRLGQLDVDATQIGGNTSGISATGVGTGYGLQLEGATDLFETNLFDQLEPTEPSSLIGDQASFGSIWQWFKRYWITNKVDQTVSEQNLFKDDGSTKLAKRVVSDDGTTQVIGELASP